MPKRHCKKKRAFSVGQLKSLVLNKAGEFIDWARSLLHWDLLLLLAALSLGALIPAVPKHYRASGVFLVQDADLRPVIFHEVYGELQRLVSDGTLMPVAAKMLRHGEDDLWGSIGQLRSRIFVRVSDNVGLVQVDFDAPKPLEAVHTLNAVLQAFSSTGAAAKSASTTVSVVVWPTLENMQVDQRARLAVAALAAICFLAFAGRRRLGVRKGALQSAREAEQRLGLSEIGRLLPVVRREATEAVKPGENQAAELAEFLAGSMPQVANGAPVVMIAACDPSCKKSLAAQVVRRLATAHDISTLLLDTTAKETSLFPMQPITQAVQPGDVHGSWVGGPAVSAHLLVACASEKGESWIGRLRERFDAIVIVAPDDMRLAGVPGLLSVVDGVVMAAQGGDTLAVSATRLCSELQAQGARMLGVSFKPAIPPWRLRAWRRVVARFRGAVGRIAARSKAAPRKSKNGAFGARLFS